MSVSRDLEHEACGDDYTEHLGEIMYRVNRLNRDIVVTRVIRASYTSHGVEEDFNIGLHITCD